MAYLRNPFSFTPSEAGRSDVKYLMIGDHTSVFMCFIFLQTTPRFPGILTMGTPLPTHQTQRWRAACLVSRKDPPTSEDSWTLERELEEEDPGQNLGFEPH